MKYDAHRLKPIWAIVLQIHVSMDRTSQYYLDLWHHNLLVSIFLCPKSVKYQVCRLKTFELLQQSVAEYVSMTLTFWPKNQ